MCKSILLQTHAKPSKKGSVVSRPVNNSQRKENVKCLLDNNLPMPAHLSNPVQIFTNERGPWTKYLYQILSL